MILKDAMLSKTRMGGLFFLVLSLAYYHGSGDIPLDHWAQTELFNAQSMPKALGILGIILSVFLIFSKSDDKPVRFSFSIRVGQVVLLLTLAWAYGLLIKPLGFIVTTSIFLAIGFLVLGERDAKTVILGSVPLAFGFWVLMSKLLGIYLDLGIFAHIF